MLSDSEDFDEDELLQMALKEQAQHNVNYQKPTKTSSKPVRNYVQLPSNQASVLVENPISKKGAVEEDDDLEVEMLSISSGDEDDRGIGVKTQAERRRMTIKGGMEKSLIAGSTWMKRRFFL
ncbi:exocyst complex component SEC5A-like [Olea europaea subsp. europaea]|uniref:Exocyst complex component SEC5A-like n=1 Tax=Olea europaea subsp. europaea TaxID=158383 RepID=A0A8S0U246_OLEEU|nr:exocyst complex component SEC5A-like [Olea europaea subsp. europaea]